MGQIVAAMATVHAPQLFTRPPGEDPAQLDADIAAMRELGRTLDETKPDVVIVLGSDHLETFFLSSVPTFAIVAGERSNAVFAGREYSLPVHLALAEDLLDKLVRAGFDMAYSQDAVLGHAYAAVYEWVLEGRDIPVVPVFINTYLPPKKDNTLVLTGPGRLPRRHRLRAGRGLETDLVLLELVY